MSFFIKPHRSFALYRLTQTLLALWSTLCTEAWSGGPALSNCSSSAALSSSRVPIAVSAAERWIVFAGEGHGAPGAAVDVYDAKTNRWSATALSEGRTNMAATANGALAMFAGGTAEKGENKSSRVDVLDLRSMSWSLHALSQGRDLLAAATACNVSLFAGGSAPAESAVVDIWDHGTGKWTTSALSVPRKKPDAVGIGATCQIVIAGGELAKSEAGSRRLLGYSSTVDIYNTVSREWKVAHLSLPRQFMGATVAGTTAMFCGGFYNHVRESICDIYTAADGAWSTARLSEARSNLRAASVGRGSRYAVFSGGNGAHGPTHAIDVYDATTGGWTRSPGDQYGAAALGSVGDVVMMVGGLRKLPNGTLTLTPNIDVLTINSPCPLGNLDEPSDVIEVE